MSTFVARFNLPPLLYILCCFKTYILYQTRQHFDILSEKCTLITLFPNNIGHKLNEFFKFIPYTLNRGKMNTILDINKFFPTVQKTFPTILKRFHGTRLK